MISTTTNSHFRFLSESKMASSGGYYSAVQRILNHMNPGLMAKFASLDTDIKRIVFARELPFVEESFTIQRALPDKSVHEAQKLREEGNALYVKKDYQRALDMYTRSVCEAPGTPGESVEDEELSLGLANRSAALFQLDKYRLALQDMILALQHGYPEELRYKLYDRMGKCFQRLNRVDDAKYAFEKAQKYLPSANLTDSKRDTWMESIRESVRSCVPGNNNNTTVTEAPTPPEWGEVREPPLPRKPISTEFPCASKLFSVSYEDDVGRYVRAKQHVKIGDVLLCESPFTAVQSKETLSTHCFQCFRRYEVPTPCLNCKVARFCSGLCRDTAWNSGHELECPFLREIHNAGVGNIGHMGLRVILAAGLETLLSRRTGDRAANKVLVDSKGEYVGNYEALLDLVGNSTLRNENEMFQYTLLAVYMLLVLKASGFFTDDILHDRKPFVVENYVAGILLRFLQIIACNGIDIMETNFSGNVAKASQTTLGLGLFPTTALFNHSCNPNLELIFYGRRVVARAIRSVTPGQQLTIDYGYIYYLTELTQRAFCLRSQYYFDCRCDACYQQWPLKAELPAGIPTLKCLHCGYPVSITDQAGTADPTSARCRKCSRHMTPLAYLEEYYESSKHCDKALDEIRRGNVEGPSRVLETHLAVMEKYLLLPVKEYVTCLSALKQCYRSMGNCVRTRGSII